MNEQEEKIGAKNGQSTKRGPLEVAPSKAGRDRRIGLQVYTGIFLSFFAAMIYVLAQPEPSRELLVSGLRQADDLGLASVEHRNADAEAKPQPKADAVAILQSPEGSISVLLKDLDEKFPINRARPAESSAVITHVPAWQTNAANWEKSNKAKIAIVIDDLGLNSDASLQLAAMKAPLTLAFLPYAEKLAEQTSLLRKNGHELLVHLPMEPKNKRADPGPNALLSGLEEAEFERRIDWNLSQFGNFVGINNHMGSALTEDPARMVRVMASLRERGFLFLDSLTSPQSVALTAAEVTRVPHIGRDIFLDNTRTVRAVIEQLSRLERIAQQRGYAVAIGHPYPETFKALQFWREGLDTERFVLVPLSQLVARSVTQNSRAAAVNAR